MKLSYKGDLNGLMEYFKNVEVEPTPKVEEDDYSGATPDVER